MELPAGIGGSTASTLATVSGEQAMPDSERDGSKKLRCPAPAAGAVATRGLVIPDSTKLCFFSADIRASSGPKHFSSSSTICAVLARPWLFRDAANILEAAMRPAPRLDNALAPPFPPGGVRAGAHALPS